MKIGVLGGTFDPIHNGHLAIAEEARERLKLAQVLFVPAGQPRLRQTDPVATSQQRVQMVRLALADKPYFKVSTIEVERAGHSHMVDTIAELQKQFSSKDELLLILGWDSLAELPRWIEPSRLIQVCRLVAVPRPGYKQPDLKALETNIPGLSQRVILLDEPCLDISATEIRNRVSRGLSIAHLVPPPVAKYIKQQKLYLKRRCNF
ncbi:MAG: nicotinate-nucleotide adenylyltransferase [Chloroflexi bacterium]|nr:nicotinate-nucleotide adenylyltransferase [Chloroflexota bacterium]